MEQMSAEPWATKATKATALTGSVTVDGVSYSRTVTITAADANGDGNNDADFQQVTAQIGSQSLSTYVMQP